MKHLLRRLVVALELIAVALHEAVRTDREGRAEQNRLLQKVQEQQAEHLAIMQALHEAQQEPRLRH